MTWCNIFEAMSDEEIYHETEYNDEYDDLSDDEKDNLSPSQEASMVKDPAAEERFQEDLTKRKGDHLKTCNHQGCVRTRDAWKGSYDLSKYV